MKNLYLPIMCIVAFTFTACTETFIADDDSTIIDNVTTDTVATPTVSDSIAGVHISIPELIDGNAVNEESESFAKTRSTIVYDKSTKKMIFSWGEVDNEAYTCVFAKNSNVQQSPYDEVTPQVFTRRAGQDVDALECSFEGPDGVRALTPTDAQGEAINYISFRPYSGIELGNNYFTAKPLNYQKLDISFKGQCNSKNVKMSASFTSNTDTYKASEKEASSHLGAYDYLVSEPTTTEDNGFVSFALKRVGAVARFYIKCPAAEVFEELQLVSHNTELFSLEGMMDLSSMTVSGDNQSISITPKKQSNVITLSYDYDASKATYHPGLDMTDTGSDYYYKNIGYIVSYMMLPPVDLSTPVPSSSTNTVNLYLVSHTKEAPTVKKYYKSANLKTPKLTSNMFYGWTSATNTEDMDPIAFSEVTVQQWQDDTAINNGDNGSGTIGW